MNITLTTLELQAGDLVRTQAGTVRLICCTLNAEQAKFAADNCTQTHYNKRRVAKGKMKQEQADEDYEREVTVRAWGGKIVEPGVLPVDSLWTVQGNKNAIWAVQRGDRNGK